ncbi:MAG: sugar phosphate nucleotidyltransferase, partial [Chloroflexi bacterium]|nr:sugar phosphate nucleotidyltransferase [Chloroflexota bacterium]
VAGKPVLGHILDKLKVLDVEEIIFITGYLGSQIREYVSSNYGFPARYVEQKQQLGQAHAIALAKEFVQGPILVIFVDTVFETDLKRLGNVTTDGIMYVKEVEDPRRFGVAVLKDGLISRLVEKPTTPVSNLAVVGLYYFKKAEWLFSAIDELMARDIKTAGEYFLADAIQIMIDQSAKLEAVTVEVWEDCGKPETLLQTNRYLLDKNGTTPHQCCGCIVRPPVYIASSALIENSIVGPYVTIADNSVVRNSIIENSIINDRALIENAILSGSLVGSDARVKGGYNTLNVGDSSEIIFEGTA